MQRKAIFRPAALGVVFLGAFSGICAQEQPKAIDPNDPRLTSSFAIEPGGSPFRFTVDLSKDGTITGVSVYRDAETKALQTLSSCSNSPDQVDENWGWGDRSQLLDHADLNFDGYEDLELVQTYIPHLGKKLYCVFLWDAKVGRFVYSQELTDIAVNLKAHPESKTLTTREDWMGGAWEESTYRWSGAKLELSEQASLLGDWGLKPTSGECSFSFTCSRLIDGKLVTTLEKNVCTPDEMSNLPECPSVPTPRPAHDSGQTDNRK